MRSPAGRPIGQRRSKRVWPVALLVLALGVAGCGGDESQTGSTTPPTRTQGEALTSQDAQSLALALFRNYEVGGATLVADVDYSSELSVHMTGDIDWKNHRGRLEVETIPSDGQPSVAEQVVFDKSEVYTAAQPDQVRQAEVSGRGGVQWVRRTPDAARPVDQLIALLVSLAATRPENPELLEQQDLVFDRTAAVGELAVVVYRSPVAEYWIGEDEGTLLRFVGRLRGFGGEASFTFTDQRSVTIATPDPATVIELNQLSP
ncbi:MAG: hypothetical protein R2754_03920 [Microthrixaceae bacterium]